MNGRILTSLAVAATLAVPATLLGTSTADRTGTFDAEGVGTIVAQGRFSAVFGTFRTPGLMLVRDPTGTAVVKLGAKRQRPRAIRVGKRIIRVYTISRARGSFFIQGRGLRVELRSPKSKVSVTLFGRGSVTRLRGTGTFHLNGGATTPWSRARLPLQVKPPPPVAPSRTKSIERSGAIAA